MAAAVLATISYRTMLTALLSDLDLYVHLYTNDIPLTKDLTGSEFVEVLYEGYVALPLKKFSPPVFNGTDAVSYFDGVQFRYVAGPEPLPVVGYYVTTPRDGDLVFAWRRPDPPFQLSLATPRLFVLVSAKFPSCP